MFYGIYTPNFGAEISPRRLAELAAEAEGADWYGFFLRDHMVRNSLENIRLRIRQAPARIE